MSAHRSQDSSCCGHVVSPEIIRRFGIVAIQEVTKKGGAAIIKLRDLVNEVGGICDVVVGAGVGHNMKGQYACIYDTATVTPLPWAYDDDDDGDGDGVDDPDDKAGGDSVEREPFVHAFRAGELDFVLIYNHADPDTATEEIAELPKEITDAIAGPGELDVICLGDFNAIPKDADTTVAASDNTYDRIVMATSTEGVREELMSTLGSALS